MAVILFAVWSFCFMSQTFIIKMENFIFQRSVAAFTLAVLVFFIVICLQPFKMFYRRGRYQLLLTLWNIVISPFGLVRFRHFFLADILTSLSQPFRDLGLVSCFFFQGGWKDHTQPSLEKCTYLENYMLTIVFFPFWFRFA